MQNRHILTALKKSEAFTDDDIALLGEHEKEHGPVINWPRSRFIETLGPKDGLAAFTVVRETKGSTEVMEQAIAALPEKPPYLEVDKNGVVLGYDPSDPSQFYSVPETGELWRWDGKREDGRGGRKSEITGEVIPSQKFPFGEPHRVMNVRHHMVAGVNIPNYQDAHDANSGGYDWFHHGYGCWVGGGGKPYGHVSAERHARVKAAINQDPARSQPLTRRQLAVA